MSSLKCIFKDTRVDVGNQNAGKAVHVINVVGLGT